MDAYIALENFIVKRETKYGTGVPVSREEKVAIMDSSRLKEASSKNAWLLIDIPEINNYLDIDTPIREQSTEVIKSLLSTDFIMTLFIYEGRKLYNEMDSLLADIEDKKEASKKYIEEFSQSQKDKILGLISGKDLITFIESKCTNHDLDKVSALLYSSGIKGLVYEEDYSERILLFNAYKDIEMKQIRTEPVSNTRMNF